MGVFKASTANNLVRERLENGSIEAVEGFDMTCFNRYCLFFDHASHLQFNIGKQKDN